MFRFSQRSSGGLVYPAFFGIFTSDVNKHDESTEYSRKKKILDRMKLEYPPVAGWEAVKQMFSKQEPNGISMELLSCVQLGLSSAVVGFIIGGIENTKFTVREFKEANQATIYSNTYDAQRSIQDKVAKTFFKGGWRMGLKCGSFLFCFSTLSTTISVYREKTSISDYSVAGLITGAIFTIPRGLPGVISGSVVGVTLGTMTGALMVTVLWAWGVNLQDVRYWQYAQYQKRVKVENDYYRTEKERSTLPNEDLASMIMTPEEREKNSRIIDELDNIARQPEKVDILIPELPPGSMFRKEEKR